MTDNDHGRARTPAIPCPAGTALATTAAPRGLAERIAAIDASALSELDAQGHAILDRLLAPSECRELAALYPHDEPFRSRVVMASHGFGRGEYNRLPTARPRRDLKLRGVARSWTRASTRAAQRSTRCSCSGAITRGSCPIAR